MNLGTILRLLGRGWISRQLKRALDKDVTPAGRKALADSLAATAAAIVAGNTQTAADDLTDVLLSLH